MFASSSKEQFTYQQFASVMSPEDQRYTASSYAFPSVETSGDHATVKRALTVYDVKTYTTYTTYTYRSTQELVREGDAWHIVASADQVSDYTS